MFVEIISMKLDEIREEFEGIEIKIKIYYF
jgi:hypothetical protein